MKRKQCFAGVSFLIGVIVGGCGSSSKTEVSGGDVTAPVASHDGAEHGRASLVDRHGQTLSMQMSSDTPVSLRPWLGTIGPGHHGRSELQARFDARLSAGKPAKTTLDAQLHRRLERGFAGVERAAGVVLDARGGKLRALFSTLPHNGEMGLAERHLATGRPENPGSALKPFTVIAALATGSLRADSQHECLGKISVGRLLFRCHGTHGLMGIERALAISDNVFFWKAAMRMKHDDLARVQHAFGLGQPVPGLPKASSGFVPMQNYYESDGRRMRLGYTLNQAIGHGDLVVTPLQLARAYAALATGELSQLILDEAAIPPKTALEASWAPHLEVVRKSLRATVTSVNGTAHFAGPTPDVAGKTGTARSASRFPREKSRTIGWFAGWAPAHEPRIVFAFRAEGYTGRQLAKLVLAALAKEAQTSPKAHRRKKTASATSD